LLVEVEESGMKQNAIQYGLLIALIGSCCAAAADPVRVDVARWSTIDFRQII
jgi:hypothetical protein